MGEFGFMYDNANKRIALFLPSMRGGGAERVMNLLSCALAERGYSVDLILVMAEGPYLAQVPQSVRVINLKASRVIKSLPSLIKYLRSEKPVSMLSALNNANIVALWARSLARVNTRVICSIHNNLSLSLKHSKIKRVQLFPSLIHHFYPLADAIIAVSTGVADDFSKKTRLPRENIKIIYNPVVTPDLYIKSRDVLKHPWFASSNVPVILGVGRLTAQKDFPTLIKAFMYLCKKRPLRLMILGEGEERISLENMVRSFGLESNVSLPGFVDNPFPYMRQASVFVLSSKWEGFGNVLVEAMACGTAVVSTNCPSGPSEILQNGKYGPLVPVEDAELLAKGIQTVLDLPPDPKELCSRATDFSLNDITDKYLKVML